MDKTPHQLSEERLQLSADFSKYAGHLAELIKKQADYFNKHRPEFKSDTACQHAFEATEDGVLIVALKLKLKALQMQMSAIRTHLQMLSDESKNLY